MQRRPEAMRTVLRVQGICKESEGGTPCLDTTYAASAGCGSTVTRRIAARSGGGWKDRCAVKDDELLTGEIVVEIKQPPPVKCAGCRFWEENKVTKENRFCICKESPYYLRSTIGGCIYKDWR